MNEPTQPSHHQWENIAKKTLSSDVFQQLITGDQMTLSLLTLTKGAEVKKHAHINEQFTCILSGSLLFKLGELQDCEVIVSAGEVLHIPASVPHSAFALEDTVDLDIFTPLRTDWLRPGGADYFKNA